MLFIKIIFSFFFRFSLSDDTLKNIERDTGSSDTFIVHYQKHYDSCEQCKVPGLSIKTRIDHFLEVKNVPCKAIIEPPKYNEIHGSVIEEDSLEIIRIHYKGSLNRKIIPGFRDYRGETLLYDKKTDNLHLIRASLRLFDDHTLNFRSKDNINISYNVFEQKDLGFPEYSKNEDANFTVTPKIDGSLVQVVAIPSNDPLFDLIRNSKNFTNYEWSYYDKENEIFFISSIRRQLLPNNYTEQNFGIIKKRFKSYENFCKILSKYVKEKKMVFCFESVSILEEKDTVALEVQTSNSDTEKDMKKQVIARPKIGEKDINDMIATRYKKEGIILFRVIVFDNMKRTDHLPSYFKGLNEEIDCVKETQVKGFKAVIDHASKAFNAILEGKCDFENSIEGLVVMTEECLIKLKYSTYDAIHDKRSINSYDTYDLLTNPAFIHLLTNMNIFPTMLKQKELIIEMESEILNFLNLPELNNVSSFGDYNRIVRTQYPVNLKSLVTKCSEILTTTDESFIRIAHKLSSGNNKNPDQAAITAKDFFELFFDGNFAAKKQKSKMEGLAKGNKNKK